LLWPGILDKPESIARAGSAKLKMNFQAGPKSLQEIAELLYDYGYIECPYEWLGSKIKYMRRRV